MILIELAIQPDHVHLPVRAWPSNSASEVVEHCKGVTSGVLKLDHPHLERLPSLWTRSYFASTAGDVSRDTVRRYIDA